METYAKLEACVTKGQFEAAQTHLASLKLALLEEETLSLLGRSTMEQAVLLAVGMHDSSSFQRYLAQLKPYYAVDPSSPLRPTLLGLELLFLIVENRLAEFHMELEKCDDDDRARPEVAFAISLEQHLMVGSYDQVLRAQVPSPHFAFFMSRLLDTVRDTIAECAEAAYTTLTLEAAKDLLMFDNLTDLNTFIQKFPNWNIQANVISFVDVAHKSEIPALKLITENLAYATELERIV